jgi:hypothetical protein
MRLMQPDETREPLPADLTINYEPRRPERDPTLGIPVHVDRADVSPNRLVTIGDSITHGFMSGAIFRTDLSWPAIVAFELGIFDEFRHPTYEAPDGPGGIPIDIERALRACESRFGPSSTGTSTSSARIRGHALHRSPTADRLEADRAQVDLAASDTRWSRSPVVRQ